MTRPSPSCSQRSREEAAATQRAARERARGIYCDIYWAARPCGRRPRAARRHLAEATSSLREAAVCLRVCLCLCLRNAWRHMGAWRLGIGGRGMGVGMGTTRRWAPSGPKTRHHDGGGEAPWQCEVSVHHAQHLATPRRTAAVLAVVLEPSRVGRPRPDRPRAYIYT